MEEQFITVNYGDTISVAPNSDGEAAVKIENTAFVEPARWINVAMSGYDRNHAIDDLIDALQQLRAVQD
ncbi:hypothetical protein I2485_15025 [Nesterenkonia sp. E16_7]|uniref:hypothetical protein n=1 Tax=unclassified Nesterenkonia TaxID=2629769 RepID=UPI001A92D0CC|nr:MULTISPECIES: hypothetical protein [unclassified Nesterenkonia]MBO0596751.1 hypothetical protein [Nesterenkonia sp. E16_10]MBO0599962.1 hypothetical protein [Nesterenkonia sp. E16_7]